MQSPYKAALVRGKQRSLFSCEQFANVTFLSQLCPVSHESTISDSERTGAKPLIIRILLMGTAAILLAAQVVEAKEKPEPIGSEMMGKLSACRKLTDRDARLDCFDRETATIDEAIARKDIVVVDREAVRETRKSLFGFELPKLPFFGGSNKDEPEQTEITAKIATASGIANGRWQIILDNGAIWQTIESSPILDPRPGDSVRIHRAAMGSYFINVSGQRGVRARRAG